MKMDYSFRVIGQDLCREISKSIRDGIVSRIFGDEHDIRIVKISQNVEFGVTSLLGKKIREDVIDKFILEYINRYVRAMLRVGESVGVIAAQSLGQPVVQATLKLQHRAGAKENKGANSLVNLNKMTFQSRIMKIHPLSGKWLEKQTLQTLTRMFEEVKLEEVLTSTYGSSKYTPEQSTKFYTQETSYVYINHRHIQEGKIVYRFRLDPSRMQDSGLTPFDIFEVLTEIKDVMVVIHPLSSFTFDLVPGNKPLTAFLEMIKKLMKTRLKGVPGLSSIGERKISTSSLVTLNVYDEEKNQTYIYLNSNSMTLFPVEELKKHVKTPENLEPVLLSQKTSIHHFFTNDDPSQELFHLVYKGRIIIENFDYTYYHFVGSLTIKELLDYSLDIGGKQTKFKELVNRKYLVSNDPYEMIEMVGKTAARNIHEYNYSEELTNSGTPLHYQHINIVCRKMFDFRLNPITPISYMRNGEVTALDKFSDQNYRHNLQVEIIKGRRSTNEQIPSAVLTGRRPNLGTGYIRIITDNKRKKEVIDLYSIARQQQKYFGEYKNIDIPKLGEIESMTKFTSTPFGRAGFPNRITGIL
jgi:hypothetical protein